MARDIAALKSEHEAAKASGAAASTRSAAGLTSFQSPDQREHGSTAAPAPTPPNSADAQKPARPLAPDEVRVLTVASAMKAAMDAYRVAHGGQEPPNLRALIPYFATPQVGADYVEFLEAQKEAAEKDAKRN